MLVPILIAAAIGYVLGALPFGYVVARAKGINIFEHGSKNPGATNVKRVLGEKFGAPGKRLGNLVFFLDALKGAVATGWPLVLIAEVSFPRSEQSNAPIESSAILTLAITGLVAALVGHSFSCFTKFKGGKGVATAAGGFAVLMPVPLAITLLVWIVTFYATRYVSLASILGAAALPVAALLLRQTATLLVLAALIAAFVIFRHRANITRLLNGTENKFVKSPPNAQG